MRAALGLGSNQGDSRGYLRAALDVDLLFMEDVRSADPELTLPHPRVMERGFVLIPLLELHPDGWGFGLDIAGAVRRVGQVGVVRIEDGFWRKKE